MLVSEFDSIYKKISNTAFPGFEGIKIEKYLAIGFYYFSVESNNDKKPSRFRQKLSLFFNSISERAHYDFNSIEQGKAMLFYCAAHGLRSDYIDTINRVLSTNKNTFSLTGKELSGFRRRIVWGRSSFNCLCYIRRWRKLLGKCGLTGDMLEYFTTKLVTGYTWLSLLRRNKAMLMKCAAIITLFDAEETENLIAQYAIQLRIPTATLQHGHFSYEIQTSCDKKMTNFAFEGFVSDEFWGWGQYLKDDALAAGIPEDRIKLVGCPCSIGYSVEENDSTVGVIGVLLESETALIPYNYNYNMIKIALAFARNHNYNVIIKPHPGYDAQYYLDKIAQEELQSVEILTIPLSEYASKVEFSICGNSSVFLELIIKGKKCFRYYISKENDRYRRMNTPKFGSLEELETIVESDGALDCAEICAYLSAPGDIAQNYGKAISNLSGNV